MKRLVFGLTMATVITTKAWATAFYTYAQWEDLDPSARSIYIAGAFDSLVGYAAADGTLHAGLYYHRCLQHAGMSNGRLAENVREFANKRRRFQKTVQGALINSLISFCGKAP
jgi:hypothetical protein